MGWDRGFGRFSAFMEGAFAGAEEPPFGLCHGGLSLHVLPEYCRILEIHGDEIFKPNCSVGEERGVDKRNNWG